MKKLISGIAASLILAASVFAVSLDDVCAGLAKHPVTTGNFVQTKTMKANNRALKSSGNFIFGLEGIVWNTLKPFPSTMAITKDRIIQTARDGSQTVIEASGNEIFGSVANTLTAVFSNDLTLLSKNFETSFTDNKNGTWSVALTPKDDTVKAVMKSLVLSGTNSSDICLNQMVMVEASENTITYDFLDQKYPKELTADEKAFFVVK